MKPLYLKITLFNPSTGDQFPVLGDMMNDLVVDIVPMQFGNIIGLYDPVCVEREPVASFRL